MDSRSRDVTANATAATLDAALCNDDILRVVLSHGAAATLPDSCWTAAVPAAVAAVARSNHCTGTIDPDPDPSKDKGFQRFLP